MRARDWCQNSFPFGVSTKCKVGDHLAVGRGRKNSNLVAGGAARLELLGVVALAVELLLVDAVSQVDQQFGTGGALEAGRMPGHVFAKLWSHDAERASRNVAFTTITLLKQKERERDQNVKTRKQIVIHGSNLFLNFGALSDAI